MSDKVDIKIPLTDYVVIQMATLDDEIATQEVIKAQADLSIAQLKKKKTEAVINLHHEKLTKRIESNKAEAKQLEPETKQHEVEKKNDAIN